MQLNEFSGNSNRNDKTAPVIQVAVPASSKNPGMKRLSGCRVLVLLVVAALLPVPAPAAELTVQQAVDQVQRETKAKVLSVQTLQVGKRRIYRIKVLTPEGQVRVVDVKAGS
jgi:hypothetical protein